MTKPQMIKRIMSAQKAALETQREKGDGPAFDLLFAENAQLVKDWMEEAEK